jgi:hydrogenase maturation factor
MENRTLTKRKDGEKMDGLKLASMYSYNCENAHLYGFSQQLKDFAEGKNADARKIRHCLTNLDGYKFCEIIAKTNKIEDPFDPRVISYYWKGIPDLRGELWHNYTTLIPILKMPMQYIFADIVDKCFVQPAIVMGSSEKSFLVKYAPVIKTEIKLVIGEEIEKTINGSLFFKATPGDFITIHYSSAIEKIDAEESHVLSQVINRSLEKFNANALSK